MKIFHRRSDRSRHRSGSFGGPKALGKIPLSVGEEYLAKIEDVSRQGNAGTAKLEGVAIFVYNARPEEKVMIRITKVAKGYATAEILSQIIKTENKKQETITDENQ
ncbi:MAG: TRAM domain-containing protein [Nitrososphaeraceae archaeon]|jgi:predicted RNA-binding protein with TRAM domain